MTALPPKVFSKRDSDCIYQEALRLENLYFARLQEERAKAVSVAHFEYEVGKKFLSKVMAKRKARLGGADESSTDNSPSSPPPQIINHPRPEELAVPHIPCTDRMQFPPPDKPCEYPAPTPTIVCPSGFKNLKFTSNFTLKFTPPECCGGPREVEILGGPVDESKILVHGRIHSDTELVLRREGGGGGVPEGGGAIISDPANDLMTFKLDALSGEWAISFPELETVAYLVRPKAGARVSAAQVYEIFSADGISNYFNLGIEMEKTGNSRHPDYVFRMLNSNLAPVGTVILTSNYKVASVTMDESLWPSQKAVILATGLLMSWELVQEIRRKKAWVEVLVVSGIILSLLMGFILVNIYLFHKDE